MDSQDHSATATTTTAAAAAASTHNRSGNGWVSHHVVQPKQVVHRQHGCVDCRVKPPVDGLFKRKEAPGVRQVQPRRKRHSHPVEQPAVHRQWECDGRHLHSQPKRRASTLGLAARGGSDANSVGDDHAQ